MYRRSYFATRELPSLNRIELLTYRRVMSAGAYDRAVPDIGLEASAVTITVAADRLTLVENQDGLRVGHVKVAVFPGDLHDYAADVVGTRTVWVR
jgi:hypothetical protein